jgi:GTPase
VDASHINMEGQIAAVEEVLDELEAGDKPQLMVFNKLDRLVDNEEALARLHEFMQDYPFAVAISAEQATGLDDLLTSLDRLLRERMVPVDLLIPYDQGELVALAHSHGFVESEEYTEHGTHLLGRLPVDLAGRYRAYWSQYRESPPNESVSNHPSSPTQSPEEVEHE